MANAPTTDGAEALLNLSTGGAGPAPGAHQTQLPSLNPLPLPPKQPPSHFNSLPPALPQQQLPATLPHLSPLPYLPHLPQQLDRAPTPLPHLDWREYPLPRYEQLPATPAPPWEPDAHTYPVWPHAYPHPYYYYTPTPAPAPQRYPRLRLPIDPRLPLSSLPDPIPRLEPSYPETSLLDRLPRDHPNAPVQQPPPPQGTPSPQQQQQQQRPEQHVKSRAPGLADLMNPADNSPGPDDTINALPPFAQPIVNSSAPAPSQTPSAPPPLVLPSLPNLKGEPVAAQSPDVAKEEPVPVAPEGTHVEDPSVPAQHPQRQPGVQEGNRNDPADKNVRQTEHAKIEEIDHPNVKDNDGSCLKIDSTSKIVQESNRDDKMHNVSDRDEPADQVKVPAADRDELVEDDEEDDMVTVEDDADDSVDQDDACTDSEVTRCPCGSTANSSVMVACDQCNTWQHSKCMGFRRTSEVPQEYYCNLCRPEEMRITCIAHPKYKERHSAHREGKDRRDSDVALAAVRPVELRKLFSVDLKQKRAGLKLSKSELYQRYATLFRNHYAKHRSSVIEGLSVLLDQHRSEIADKLDNTLRRMRSSSGEATNEGTSERRRGATLSTNDPLVETPTSRSHGQRSQGAGRSTTQKRTRPQSLSLDHLEVQARADASCMPEISGELDTSGSDMPSGRGMSREERKLQQTMKLFARMEEREREKKKPRTADTGSSPKTTHLGRPKTPRVTSQVRSTSSPKTSSTPPHVEPSELKAKSAQVETRQQQQHGHKSLGPMSKSETESARELSRRDRDHRIRERPERVPTRRKDTCALDNSNIVSNRRRGLLDRERSNEGKRRRVGAMTREAEKRTSLGKEQVKRDPSLDFKIYVPGPSVLGSREIIKSRLSRLDREFISAEESTMLESERHLTSRSNKKYWLLASARAAENDGELQDTTPCPMKKRFKALPVSHCSLDDNNGMESVAENDQDHGEVKASTVSVSMVVVSEKGSLPDNGEILESSRLILPSTKCEDRAKYNEKTSRTLGCLKKRKCMFSSQNDLGQPELKAEKSFKSSQNSSSRAHGHTTPASPTRSSPAPASPLSSSHSQVSPSPVSPQMRSPQLTALSPSPTSPEHSSSIALPGNTVPVNADTASPAVGSPAISQPASPTVAAKIPPPTQIPSPRLRSSPVPPRSIPLPVPRSHGSARLTQRNGSPPQSAKVPAQQSPKLSGRQSPKLMPPQPFNPTSSLPRSVKQSPKSSPKQSSKENLRPPALEMPKSKLSPQVQKVQVQSPVIRVSTPTAVPPRSPSPDKVKQPTSKIGKTGLAKIPLSRPAPRLVSKPAEVNSGVDKAGQQQFGAGTVKRHAPSKPAVPTLVIPLSKPKPMRAAGEMELLASQPSSAKPQFGTDLRKSPTPNLGLRSIRSVPISQVRKTDGKAKEMGRRQGSNSSCDDVGITSSPSTEVKQTTTSSSATISDIFQQRLQGFLNPTPSNSGDHTGGGNSTVPKVSTGLSSKPVPSESLRPINRLSPRRGSNGSHGISSSYRVKSSDNLWGRPIPPAVAPEPHSAPPFNSISNGTLPSTSLSQLNGRVSASPTTDGSRYNGGRGSAPGRDEKGRNNALHNRTWNNYLHKNGWGSGPGIDHHSGDGAGRGNRRGRH